MPEKSIALIACSICSRPVRTDRIEQHMSRVHSGCSTGSLKKFNTAMPINNAQKINFVHCDICGVNVLASNLKKHQERVHEKFSKSKNKNSINNTSHAQKSTEDLKPIGVKVIEGLKSGLRYRASHFSRCDECKKRIVFLSVEKNAAKAFEVDQDRLILGIHACDGSKKSESIYAFSGGIIDSNRRKH